jgi:hypothetical protein
VKWPLLVHVSADLGRPRRGRCENFVPVSSEEAQQHPNQLFRPVSWHHKQVTAGP